jgi:hypothetical protein
MQLIDPRGRELVTSRRLAPRPRGRRGPEGVRRIGFLSNEGEHLTGPHFPGYTRVLEVALRERLGPLEVRREIKPVLSRPAEPDMIAQFLEYEGVINGLAK